MANNNSLPINYGYTLREGQRGWTNSINFAQGLSQDVAIDIDQIGLSCVRTMFIDNSGNGDAITITIPGVSQLIRVGPRVQMCSPVVQLNSTFQANFTCNATSGASTFLCSYTLLNYDLPPFEQGNTGYTQVIIPATRNGTDYSGTITAGGTSQSVELSNRGRSRIFIQNPLTAAGQGIAGAESLFIGFGGAANNPLATPSIELQPGQIYDTGTGPCDQTAFRLNAATTGHRFVCRVY